MTWINWLAADDISSFECIAFWVICASIGMALYIIGTKEDKEDES